MIKEIEIEKKYKVKKLPDNLEKFEHLTIEQSYLNKGGAPIRLRKFITESGVKYIFSKKIPKDQNLLEKTEYNIELSEELYKEFLKAKEGRTIIKTRYKIPLENGAKMDLDIFHDFFEGLCIAEIEYTSVEQANTFKIPEWLEGVEGIEDFEKLTNSYMATKAIDINEYKEYILNKD